MIRRMMFRVRLSDTERGLAALLARRMERTESDAVRQIIREAARLLGSTLAPAAQPAEAGGQLRVPRQDNR